MQQAKFSIGQEQVKFLNNYTLYGFKDKSTMVRTALEHLRQKLEQERLKQSADLYAEVYAEDSELKELTDTAIEGWPE